MTTERSEATDVLLTKLNDLKFGIHTRRYGNKHDGGYVIPTGLDIKKVITIGVGKDISFEVDFQKANPDCEFELYDHTVSRLPTTLPNSTFHKRGLGTKAPLRKITDLVGMQEEGVLLKIDCESAEWDCGLESFDFAGVDCVAIELHRLQHLEAHAQYLKCLSRIFEDFDVVSVQANNGGGAFRYGGVTVPIVLEVTFLRKPITQRLYDSSAKPPEESKNKARLPILACPVGHDFTLRSSFKKTKTSIIIPVSPCGGKNRDNTELRYALRSIAKNFVGEYEVLIAAKKLPDWVQNIELIPCPTGGLKTALANAAEARPNGFLWWYDDCLLVKPERVEMLRVTPGKSNFSSAQTRWAKMLDQIKERLETEGHIPRDYSRPHGPYWFNKSMVDEGFEDWPKMKAKFPWESWILSKRRWPFREGVVRQYYGAFRTPPSAKHTFVNYSDQGFTKELREWMASSFPTPSKFETQHAQGVVIGLPKRPRWEEECVKEMAKVGIQVGIVQGVDGHHDEIPIKVDVKAFKKRFGRVPVKGEIGCFASHIQLARLGATLPAFSQEHPDWRLVFEDDAVPVGINHQDLSEVVLLAEAQGFNCVMLHTGRNNRRGKGATSVTPTNGKDVFTHACLFHTSAYAEMSKWTMVHPIDHAIVRSKVLRVGVLNGAVRFDQRSPKDSKESIHRERKATKTPVVNVATSPPFPNQPQVKIIHQVWVQGEKALPKQFMDNRELWSKAFPEFELKLWDEESATLQWPDFARVKGRCYHHATRADLILARAIRDFGGLATGTDCTPNNVEALRKAMSENQAFVVRVEGRPEVSNGLQWSAGPQHPFWKCVCNHQLRGKGVHLSSPKVNRATGPRCYMEAFSAYPWGLTAIPASTAYTHDWKKGWSNKDAMINPGYAASWTK